MKLIKICIVLFLLATVAKAEVILPAVISDNMVLQQATKVALWGKAQPGVKIKIKTSWDNKAYSVKASSDSSWRIGVRTPVAGGPYTISFDDGDLLTLQNVLIGEVWVCSGQSNMEMPVKGFKKQPVAGSDEILREAKNANIRLIQLEKQLSTTPEFDCKSSPWRDASAEHVSEFSAVGYIYGKILQEKLQVPVGIIMTAWGGTKIEAWMNEKSLSGLSFVRQPLLKSGDKITHNSSTVLFNAMIKPLAGYGIKGFLWYQGEANRTNYDQYDELMAAMVSGWRKAWAMGELPFYYVQIAPFKYTGDSKSTFVREAQLKASTIIPKSGMVVSLDVGKQDLIHPPDKITIGKRLASWALTKDYGITDLAYASPVYKSIDINGNKVQVYFDNAKKGLRAEGKELKNFEVAGADKKFYPATATITAQGVTVSSEMVKAPVAVRYGFKDWVVGDLFSAEGLPVSSFRTDDWEPTFASQSNKK